MPIIKQAIKRMRQDKVRTMRNKHYDSMMKSMLKLCQGYIQNGELDKAKKVLPQAVSAIDTAVKKGLLHKNNAARKKSQLEKALTAAIKNPAPPKETKVKKAEAPAKTEAPKAEKPALADKKAAPKPSTAGKKDATKKAPAKKK